MWHQILNNHHAAIQLNQALQMELPQTSLQSLAHPNTTFAPKAADNQKTPRPSAPKKYPRQIAKSTRVDFCMSRK